MIKTNNDFIFFQSLVSIIKLDMKYPGNLINPFTKIENNTHLHKKNYVLSDYLWTENWNYDNIVLEFLKYLEKLQYDLKNYEFNKFQLIKNYLAHLNLKLTDSLHVYKSFYNYLQLLDFDEEFNVYINKLRKVNSEIELILFKIYANEIVPLTNKETLMDKLKTQLDNNNFLYIRPFHKSGSWGEIHLIQHKITDEKRAIKLYKEALDEEMIEIFNNDIRKIYEIQHPNIIKIYSSNIISFHNKNYGYIIMEYVNGKALQEIPKNIFQEQKPIKKRLYLFIKILETIQTLRTNLEIHGDLHLGNILIEKDKNNIKIIDPCFSFFANKTRLDSDLIYIKEELLDFFFNLSEFNNLNLTKIRKITNINGILQFFDDLSNEIENDVESERC